MSKYSNGEPNMVNNQMKNDVLNKITTRSSSYADTNTNMFVDLFADPGKLLPSDERIEYGDPNPNANDDDEKLDDDTDKYESKHKSQTKVPPKIFQEQNAKDDADEKDNKHQSHQSHQSSDKQSYNGSTSSDNEKKPNDAEDESTWSKEELQLRKLDMMRKLGELAQCGVKLSQNYSMDSDYRTMKFEYDLHTGIRAKQNSVNWMSNMMIGIVKGIELLNDNVNPFDIKFDNTWSNKVTHDINDYYDVLGDIYEKYTTPGKKMAPELKLFLMLSGSAISIQMYKGVSKMSGSAKELDANPDRVKNLRQKAQEDDARSRSNASGAASASSAEEKTSSYVNRQKLQERINKAHEDATQKAIDLQLIKNNQQDYEKMQNMAKSNKMDKLNNTLILSESARSLKSKKTMDTKSEESPQINLNEYKKEIIRNQRLLDAQKLLKGFENVAAKSSAMAKQEKTKPTTKPKELKMTTTSKQSKQSSDSASIKSSSSSISMNPQIDNILNPVISAQQAKRELKMKQTTESSSSVSTSSSDSTDSSSSSSSKRKGLVVDSDEIRSSDKESRTKTTKSKLVNFNDDAITRESISLGNKSGDSGSTSKRGRGRPRKEPIQIKLGK